MNKKNIKTALLVLDLIVALTAATRGFITINFGDQELPEN